MRLWENARRKRNLASCFLMSIVHMTRLSDDPAQRLFSFALLLSKPARRNGVNNIVWKSLLVKSKGSSDDSSIETEHEFRMPSAQRLISELSPLERGIGVGIDLGTTNSCISMLTKSGIPIIVPVDGQNTMPSIVTLIPSQSITSNATHCHAYIGKEAIAMRSNCSTHDYKTYVNVKRIMGLGASAAARSADIVPHLMLRSLSERKKGRSIRDKKKKDEMAKLNWEKEMKDASENPAKLCLPNLRLETTVDGRIDQPGEASETILPEAVSAMILRKLFQAVEAKASNGEKVTRAVVGVPAYFDDKQREATIRAVTLASQIPHERVRLLREPEAAALAYGFGKQQVGKGNDDELVLVFDLGGGTFDVSILEIGNGVMEVIATSGNNMIGGSDFDAKLAQFFMQKILDHGVTRNVWKEGTNAAMAMIKAAEQVRIYLSNAREVVLLLPLEQFSWIHMLDPRAVIYPEKTNFSLPETGYSNGTHMFYALTRNEMESLCMDEFLSLLKPIREVAIMAGVMLPGDANPAAVAAALQIDNELGNALQFDEFYSLIANQMNYTPDSMCDVENSGVEALVQVRKYELKDQKRAQQHGRKLARETQRDEKKFREEKRRVEANVSKSTAVLSSGSNGVTQVRIRDGIVGRRLTQVVLVGGATRMPAIGRMLSVITGIVPQRTVNPDEAVALGCAVQVGILDGINTHLSILSPIEAAMIRALAKRRIE